VDTYIYAADCYCEDCAEGIKAHLRKVGQVPKNVHDETTFDSDRWPKGPYEKGGGASDTPQHCGCGDQCVNAMETRDGYKVGVWLENPLTQDGEDYVLEQIEENPDGLVSDFWAKVYAEEVSNARRRKYGSEQPAEEDVPGA